MVDVPSLVGSVVARVEDSHSHVGILMSRHINAESGVVSKVSSLAVPEGNFLIWLSLPWSHDNNLPWSVLQAVLVGQSEVSSVEGSD